jgi:hypothetical protein
LPYSIPKETTPQASACHPSIGAELGGAIKHCGFCGKKPDEQRGRIACAFATWPISKEYNEYSHSAFNKLFFFNNLFYSFNWRRTFSLRALTVLIKP